MMLNVDGPKEQLGQSFDFFPFVQPGSTKPRPSISAPPGNSAGNAVFASMEGREIEELEAKQQNSVKMAQGKEQIHALDSETPRVLHCR